MDDKMSSKIFLDAAGYNNVAEVKRLICLGADVNMKNEYGWTALHLVSYKNEADSHFEVIELLLKNGADVNAQDDQGRTPIFDLVFQADFKTVKMFVDFGADLKIKDNANYNSLFPAVFSNTLEVIKLLIENGADAGIRTKCSYSILHCACRGDLTDIVQIVKFLIQNGADIETRDRNNCPPLAVALGSNSVRLVQFFCKYADFSSVGFHGYSEISTIENKDIWMTILEHLAKLEFLDITVDPNFFDEISKRKRFVAYFNNCITQLEAAKNKKLKNSWVTYFDLLVDSKRKLKNYAGNRDLIRDFKNSDCFKKFPIYAFEMQENVDKAIIRRKAFDKSAVALSNCLTILNPTHLIIRDVLDCLTHKDYIVFLSKK